MNTILCLFLAVIFAMMPLGATAKGLRLRRSIPVINVGLGAIREVVAPFGSFIVQRQHQEEEYAEEIIDDNELVDSFSLSYSMSMSMSMSMLDDIPLPTEAPTMAAPRRLPSRFRQGRYRRKTGGL